MTRVKARSSSGETSENEPFAVFPLSTLDVQNIGPMRAISSGFYMDFLEAHPPKEHPVKKADLTCGAGLGSPWLSGHVELKSGRKFYFRIDARDILQKLCDYAVTIPKCDGNHGGDPCADRECWAREKPGT